MLPEDEQRARILGSIGFRRWRTLEEAEEELLENKITESIDPNLSDPARIARETKSAIREIESSGHFLITFGGAGEGVRHLSPQRV